MREVEVKVPGKMMFAGEYSVLRGGRALAVTIDAFLTLKAVCRAADNRVTKVTSNLWDEPRYVSIEADGSEYSDEPLLEAVHTCQHAYGQVPSELDVSSDLEVAHGVGSSSAVRLATCLAFDSLAAGNDILPDWESVRRAYVLQRAHQGRASGYDVATQYLGGAVSFQDESTRARNWPTNAASMSGNAPEVFNRYFMIFVGGAGAPTKETMRSAYDWLLERDALPMLTERNEELIDSVLRLISEETPENLREIIRKMESQRDFFASCPAFPQEVGQSLSSIPELGETWSFKATGAGGEDAILVLALPDARQIVIDGFAREGWYPLQAVFSAKGARVAYFEEQDV